jgi:hypothetical protein
MIKKILTLMITSLLLVSCGSKQGKQASSDNSAERHAVKVEFASLIENPADYVDKNIEIQGKVVHVCMHSGKKMFIVGDDPDTRLFISAGEDTPKFPLDLVGSNVSVEGKIEKIVTADKPAAGNMTASLETKASENSQGENTASAAAETGEDCATEAAVAKQTALGDLMMIYNKHVVVK